MSKAEYAAEERSAIDAVARHFSAAAQNGEAPPAAYLTVRGRKAALDVAVLPQQPSRGKGKPVAKARFRDDAAARRVLREVGNRVRFRVLSGHPKWNARAIGFVFTGDPTPGVLAGAMHSLRDAIAACAKERPPRTFTGDRWLVLTGDHWIADFNTYRRACSQLPRPNEFGKLLMLFDDGKPIDLIAPQGSGK